MNVKSPFLPLVGSLLIVALVLISTPGAIEARTPPEDNVMVEYATGNTGPLMLPESGLASLVFTNHNGGAGELIVDLQGTYYKIAPKSGDVSPHAQVFLAPGTYSYTASVAGVGAVARDIQLAAGQIIGLGFAADDIVNVATNGGAPGFGTTNLTLRVFEEDLTSQFFPGALAEAASWCSPSSC